jgi:hypothetical protein
MTIQCSSCHKSFEVPEGPARATMPCPHCGRIVVLGPAPREGEGAAADPGTEAYVEALEPAEEPTAIGVARATLSLPKDKRVAVAILSGDRKGDVIVFEKPSVVLGRVGGGGDVELPDPEISRSHASVDCLGSRVVLRDMGSRNGTFVDEQKIQTRELEDKGEFRVGSTRLMLLVTPLD